MCALFRLAHPLFHAHPHLPAFLEFPPIALALLTNALFLCFFFFFVPGLSLSSPLLALATTHHHADKFETKLEEHPGQLLRAGVELAKTWRTDKHLRHLEAMLIAVDNDMSLTLTGNGDVLSEPGKCVV